MDRTYKLKHLANKGKRAKVIQTVQAYRDTADIIAREQWRCFYEKSQSFNRHHRKGVLIVPEPILVDSEHPVLSIFVKGAAMDMIDKVVLSVAYKGIQCPDYLILTSLFESLSRTCLITVGK